MISPDLMSWQLLPWLFLILTFGLAFYQQKQWPVAMLMTVAAGFAFQAINYIGFAVVSVILLLAYITNKVSHKALKPLLVTILVLTCLALAAHLLPGFNNLLVLDEVNKSSNSIDYTMYFNFDKPFIVFILLLAFPTVLNTQQQGAIKLLAVSQLPLFIPLMFIAIFVLAIVLELITIDVSVPTWWWLFALNNLLFTCVVEEVFFRGFIQQHLTKHVNAIGALCITSVLFGVAHFAGGAEYVFVATIAGFLYGGVYLVSGKLGYAILCHFALNIIHLIFFTYPLAVK